MLEHDRVRPSLATLRVLAERLREPVASLLDTPPPAADQARSIIQQGESLLRQHRFTDAHEVFAAGSPPARESGETRLQIRVELGVGQALAGLRQFDLAERHLVQGRRMAESISDVELTAAAANALGFLAFRGRRFAEARGIFQSALDLLNASDEPDSETRGKLLANLGRVYVELGLPVQAMQYLREGAGALRHAADPVQRALLLFNLGVAAERQRAFAESRAYFDQSEALLKVHENVRLLGTVKRSLGLLHLEEGRLADAERELVESRRLAQESHDDEGTAQTLVELARLRVRTGAVEDARRDAAEAEAIARRIHDDAEAARAAAAEAEALRAAGQLDLAVARYTQAIKAFERLGMAADLSSACRDLGYLHLTRGEDNAAAHLFARAFDLLRHSMTPSSVQ